jgi:hypothetical protein
LPSPFGLNALMPRAPPPMDGGARRGLGWVRSRTTDQSERLIRDGHASIPAQRSGPAAPWERDWPVYGRFRCVGSFTTCAGAARRRVPFCRQAVSSSSRGRTSAG